MYNEFEFCVINRSLFKILTEVFTVCGIVGYVGKRNATEFLLGALEKLEYRGYDSAGMAVVNDSKISLVKKAGRINTLCEAFSKEKDFDGFVGIGHTRWATHGKPSEANAHPHVSGKIAVVHNGIIENYATLKDSLVEKGMEFKSETDTEVIAVLIDYLYDGDIFSAVKKSILSLKGSFALGIICQDFPDRIIAVKKESPLIIGRGKDENYIASDVSAFVSQTDRMTRLAECEIAVVTAENAECYDFSGKKIEKYISRIDWNVGVSDKKGHKHFMLKEILEQELAVERTISKQINGNIIAFDNPMFTTKYMKTIKKIFVVACGSSYHVGLAAKFAFEQLIGIPVEVDLASEFRYRLPILGNETLVIIISQSGETADSLAALREAKRLGSRVLAIVNVIESSIASEASFVFYTWAGLEVAVATTKAYSAQLALMYVIALKTANSLEKITPEKFLHYLEEIKKIPSLIEEILNNREKIKKISEKYRSSDNVFFIGRGTDYATCMEGSLKFKEISYIHSEAYAAGELKHGTISLVENKTLVIALAANKRLFEKTLNNIREVKARGAVCMAIAQESQEAKISQIADDYFLVPEISEIFLPSLTVIPLQLFSYYSALLRGLDIDKPRNLAKSVTVE
jgi:glucosamine--fructose-6-phosphate aminotransferase (isomerizing)